MPDQNDLQMSEEEKLSDLRSFILKRWALSEAFGGQVPWTREVTRWHELVFCILARLGQPELDESMARSLTNTLADLAMLDIETLAAATAGNDTPNFTNPNLDLMRRILERAGLPAKKAKVVATTIFDAAYSLDEESEGRVQNYFRFYGDLMLENIDRHFHFSAMDDEDALHVFTRWLQTVLNMPADFSDPIVESLADQFDLDEDDVIDVVDELDLNLACLRDIVGGTFENEEG
ncbi:MAG: hypothetical protein ABIK79_02050 [Chloroflexota bacterium]|nr:hypothetical protein [Anaerolineae bacterium]